MTNKKEENISEQKAKSSPRSEICAFYQKCMEWMAQREPYEIDSIRAVVRVVNEEKGIEAFSKDELWCLHKYLTLGIAKNEPTSEDEVGKVCLTQLYKLIDAVSPFLTLRKVIHSTKVMMSLYASEDFKQYRARFIKAGEKSN